MVLTPNISKHFTKNEMIFSKISTKRLLKVLNSDDVILGRFYIDTNGYGEFLFINFDMGDIQLFVYGLGYHVYRDVYYLDEWAISVANRYKNTAIYSKEMLKEMIDQRYEEIKKEAKNHEQCNTGSIFQELADVSDDDGAISMMEDFGLF